MWGKCLEIAAGWNSSAVVIRLVFSVLVGMIVGIDRGFKRRGAGVKTHTLVCLGSTLVMLTGQYIYMNFEGNMDISRMAAQVISGVGFLGVGTIIVTGRNQVRGLTTAAGLWSCACLGLAIGIGFVEGALVTVLLVIITLNLLSRVDGWLHRYARVFELYLEFSTNKCISSFVNEMHKQDIRIISFEIGKSRIKGEGPTALAVLEVRHRGKRPELMNYIRQMDSVKFVEEL